MTSKFVMKALRDFGDWLELAIAGRGAFIIRIKGGGIDGQKGEVNRRFMLECLEILNREGIAEATVSGDLGSGGVALKFSNHVPENVRQRIRNVCALCG